MGAMLFGLRILFIVGAVLAVAMEVFVFAAGLFFVAQAQRALDAPPYRANRGWVAPTVARLPDLTHRGAVAQLPGRNRDGDRRALPAPFRVSVRDGEGAEAWTQDPPLLLPWQLERGRPVAIRTTAGLRTTGGRGRARRAGV